MERKIDRIGKNDVNSYLKIFCNHNSSVRKFSEEKERTNRMVEGMGKENKGSALEKIIEDLGTRGARGKQRVVFPRLMFWVQVNVNFLSVIIWTLKHQCFSNFTLALRAELRAYRSIHKDWPSQDWLRVTWSSCGAEAIQLRVLHCRSKVLPVCCKIKTLLLFSVCNFIQVAHTPFFALNFHCLKGGLKLNLHLNLQDFWGLSD